MIESNREFRCRLEWNFVAQLPAENSESELNDGVVKKMFETHEQTRQSTEAALKRQQDAIGLLAERFEKMGQNRGYFGNKEVGIEGI